MEKEIILQVKNISKTFFSPKGAEWDTAAIENVSLDVRENEFLVLLGPGQCGKTVLLNIIAGLISPTTGKVKIKGDDILAPHPKISFVFQKIGLFEWKTVMENVELGLKYKGVSKQERRQAAQRFINLVGLQKFEKAYPNQLSGGMKQRAGIARAYSMNPEILLMDEPFGALDAQTRYYMQEEILKIWGKEKRTVIFVTNNIEEAIYLGDRIIQFTNRPATVKNEYNLEHLGRPRDYVDKEFLKMRTLISDNEALMLE